MVFDKEGDAMRRIDKINSILVQRGMNSADLQRMVNITDGAISQWNTGRTSPSNRSLRKIADALEVDIVELMADDEITQEENPASATGDGISDFDRLVLDFIHSMTYDEIRRLLVYLKAPKELLDALDREAPAK